MKRILAIVIGSVLLTGGLASAGAPFGGDDPGCVPDTKDALKCSDGAAKAFLKAYQAVIKCHIKQADGVQKSKPADDETCETSNGGKSAKEKLDAALAKLATVCTGTNVLVNVATLETKLFASKTTTGSADQQMGAVWCDGSTPIDATGDDAGTVDPTSKASQKCADGVAKNLSKLIGAVNACHVKAADAAFKLKTFDEEACEESGPKAAHTKYNDGDAKLSCPQACLQAAQRGALATAYITLVENMNGQFYPCAGTTTTTTLLVTTTTVVGSTTTTTLPTATLAVLRAGDGTESLSVADTAVHVFIDKFHLDGTSGGASIALPTALNGGGAGNQPFALASDQTEGLLTRSADTHFLTCAGYATTPGTTPVVGAASTAVQRVVARINAAGVVNTTTLLGTTAYTANNVRSAATVDGTAFWTGGAGNPNGGVWYATLGGGTVTQIETTPGPTSIRAVEIFSNQLFGTGNNNGFKQVFTIGVGLPTATGQTVTTLPGMTDASPFGYVFFDLSNTVAGLDTLYVADNTAFPSPPGGIQKWTFDGTTWTKVNTFATGLSNAVRGITGFVSGGKVYLAATTNEATANHLALVIDDGSASPTASVVTTAPTGTQFRGVALAAQ